MDSTVCEIRSPLDQTDNTISFSQEELMPIVRKCFQRFCDLHWSMLALGTPDVSTVAAVSDVVAEIIQTLAAETFRVIMQMCSHATAALSPRSETFSVSLENSFSQSLASALSLPEEKSTSVEALRLMVESEVSEKVNSILSQAMNSPVLPPEPVIYVSSSKPMIGKLRQMVHLAAASLRRYAAKISTTCHRPLDDSSDFDESSESLKSNISSLAATDSVRDILTTWTAETLDDEDQSLPPPSINSPEFQKVASEIVETIVSDLHYCEPGNGAASSNKSPGSHFNMGFISHKVHRFIASKSPYIKDTASRKVHERCRFFKVAKRQFEKMVTDLKSAFKRKEPEFLVDLRIKSVARSTSTLTRLVRSKKSKTPVDFKSIKPDIQKLLASKTLEDIMSSGEMQKFLRELTDKMYDHLMVDATYQIPVAPPGRCLSDFILCKTRKEVGQSHLQFSPEVLYAVTEDFVGKFVQSLMLCIEQPLDGHSEEVSGALADIEVLFSKIATPPEGSNVKEPEVPVASKKQTPKLAWCARAAVSISSVEESFERRVASVPVHLIISSQFDISVSPADKDSELRKSSSAPGKTTNLMASPKPETKGSSVAPLLDTEVLTNKIKTPVKESSIKQQEVPVASKKQTTKLAGVSSAPSRIAAGPKSKYCRVEDNSEWLAASMPALLFLTPQLSLTGTRKNLSSPEKITELVASQKREAEESDIHPEKSVSDAISGLLFKVMTKSLDRCEQPVTVNDYQVIMTRLSALRLDDISVSSAEIIKKSKKISKSMVKDLLEEFGSAEKLLQAAKMTEDPSFDDVFVKFLKIHLKVIPRPTPRKSAVARFFSALGRAFLKPFRRRDQN